MTGAGSIGSAGLAAQLERIRGAEARLDGAAGARADAGGLVAEFRSALDQVAATQNTASDLAAAYETGAEVDVARVMMARQEASLAFEATLQIRNKLLSAYKDIMSMPV